MIVACLQIFPAPLQVHMGRSSTSSDLRSISKPHLYSPLTSFKLFSTRTPIYQSVSPPFLPHLYVSMNAIFSFAVSLVCKFSSYSLFTVWPCPAAWTQPCHAKPPLRSFDKGRFSGNHWNTSQTFPLVTSTIWNIIVATLLTLKEFESPSTLNYWIGLGYEN